MERLAELNPDHLFIMKVPGAEKKLESLKGNSLWNALPAVKEGKVHLIDRSAFTIGMLATEYGVKSIIAALAQ